MTALEVRSAEVRLAAAAAPGTRATVDRASLNVACGQVGALLGPSGAGKSTLLRAIAGLERLDAGEIRFGETIWSGDGVHRPAEARRCGVVFQDYALFPHLTAMQNVTFGLQDLSREERRARGRRHLDAMRLSERANAYPHELSGGEQQRVALARALAPGPAVMLLDEPFSGLDRGLRTELRADTVAALRASGAAALIVTHDAEEAMAAADTIALMVDGRIIQTGAPDQLYLRPNCAASARLLGDVEIFEALIARGAADTPLGRLPAPGLDDGAACHVLVRPEGVLLKGPDEAGADAVIESRRVASGLVQIKVRLASGRSLQARASLADPRRPGDPVRLALDPAFVSIVAA